MRLNFFLLCRRFRGSCFPGVRLSAWGGEASHTGSLFKALLKVCHARREGTPDLTARRFCLLEFIMQAYANPRPTNPNKLLVPATILTQSARLTRSALTATEVYDLPVSHGSAVKRSKVKRGAAGLADQERAYLNPAPMPVRDGSRAGSGFIRGIKVNGKEESETLQPLCSLAARYQRVGFSVILFMLVPRDGWNTAHTGHH